VSSETGGQAEVQSGGPSRLWRDEVSSRQKAGRTRWLTRPSCVWQKSISSLAQSQLHSEYKEIPGVFEDCRYQDAITQREWAAIRG
jgi:hypothetical protein